MDPETESEFVLSSSGRNYKKINRTPVSEIQCVFFVQKCVCYYANEYLYFLLYSYISHTNSQKAVGYVELCVDWQCDLYRAKCNDKVYANVLEISINYFCNVFQGYDII